MAVSIRDIYRYLVTTLEGDSQLQDLGVDVYALKAPEDAPPPFLILERNSGVHEYHMGKEAIQKHWVFVKSVTNGEDGGTLGRQIMDRVHDLITGQTPVIPTGYVARIEAQTDMEYVEAETGNIQYFHVGTVYRFYLGNN